MHYGISLEYVLINTFTASLSLKSYSLCDDDEDDGLRHVYDGVIKGYAGRFSHAVLQQIRSMPEVDYVERDQIVRIQDVQYGAPWVGFPLTLV